MSTTTDYLIVGSGFYGAVLAERLASQLGKRVTVLEARNHIGGNCYSEIDTSSGIEFHKYGTHIFHTSNVKVWNYLSQFMRLNGYHHQVWANHSGRLYRLPFNLETINSFFGRNFTPQEAKTFIEAQIQTENILEPKNLEEKAVSMVGRRLYETFIQSYTLKQWGKNPSELPASIISRIPVRFNYCSDYFNNCRWQGIPEDGYTAVFKRLLSHPNIQVHTNIDFFSARHDFQVLEKTIYTGPIDRYYGYQFGPLEWRSVRFESSLERVNDFQGTSVVNYCDIDKPYVRIHEPLHLHPERKHATGKTLIVKEFSGSDQNQPSYPIRTKNNLDILMKYKELAELEPNFVFGGRLGDYAYYDMDMTIAAALNMFERLAK